MVQTEAGFVRVPILVWANGVWQLSYSNERIDVYAHPLAIEELTGECSKLSEAMDRLRDALVETARLCASHGCLASVGTRLP